jgi:hypothetical protein
MAGLDPAIFIVVCRYPATSRFIVEMRKSSSVARELFSPGTIPFLA